MSNCCVINEKSAKREVQKEVEYLSTNDIIYPVGVLIGVT